MTHLFEATENLSNVKAINTITRAFIEPFIYLDVDISDKLVYLFDDDYGVDFTLYLHVKRGHVISMHKDDVIDANKND